MNSHYFVTSLNKKLFDQYAHNLFKTYTETNQQYPLYVYTEDKIDLFPKIPNVTFIDLFERQPECKKFADRHKNQLKEYVQKHPGVKEFRFDAVRFSYKVFAQVDAKQYGNKMFFIDADCVFNKQMNEEVLNKLLPDDSFISFFDRPASYTETGFVGFNNTKPCADIFYKEYLNYYVNDKIFELVGYLDCDVFDATREKTKFQQGYKENKLGDGGKAHIMARDKFFNQYVDHKKGARKTLKHSPEWSKHNVR